MEPLIIADRQFKSRLFIGTGKFGDHQLMRQAIISSETEMVTVALKRLDFTDDDDDLLLQASIEGVHLLPNTSGARNAKEAILAAQLAREAFQTNWVKLEIHPDPKYLMPDGEETLLATQTLAKEGFIVLPYVHADPVLCKKLEDAGAAAVMPLGSPIGSNLGLKSREFIRIIIEQSTVPVIIDAGLGAPSHAAEAMEMGADAVLVNTAIAIAENPVLMALAFKQAVEAGRLAYEAGLPQQFNHANATSPLTSLLND
jgi:thiazole synthase